ncbi:hypothetical protein [Streptomyces endophytica]|uniref:Transposase n=1 Tax=Streptomyces endophytica TaxID=2991496 RepID=A0ABY6PJ18_9ACTN|nr:hypothetical protein [Streptomyces endophytica]UZJ33498.1 hypothetical protein OJ254_28500 [Streptomyces endophytica]
MAGLADAGLVGEIGDDEVTGMHLVGANSHGVAEVSPYGRGGKSSAVGRSVRARVSEPSVRVRKRMAEPPGQEVAGGGQPMGGDGDKEFVGIVEPAHRAQPVARPGGERDGLCEVGERGRAVLASQRARHPGPAERGRATYGMKPYGR